jgi:NADH dehydrogenase FAD-containing subunit
MAQPRIIIVGAGFGGLAVANALKKAPAEIIVIDRTNHHVFQPLLYQVATSVLSPSQIGFPIRGILGKQKNTTVIQGEVTGVDKDNKRVFVSDTDQQNLPIGYDYLVLATGATHSYFGRNEFEEFAPGLKSLADAVAARIFFGGANQGVDQRHTWAWDGSNWSQLNPTATPEPREQFGTVWDQNSHQFLVFGGYSFGTNHYFGDTWKLKQ